MKKLLLIVIIAALSAGHLNAANTTIPHPAKRLKAFDESTRIKLMLGDKSYELQNYNMNYVNQPADDKTTTNGFSPMFGYQTSVLSISIRSSKIDQEFLDWMLSPEKDPKNGQIIVYDADSGKTIRTIIFTGITPYSYNENANSNANFSTPYNNFGLRFKTVKIKL